MATPALKALWNLHQIDVAILEARRRATALDTGQESAAKLKALQAQFEAGEGGLAKKLSAEQADLELLQKGTEDKIKGFEKQLFGGKIVNPREVENFQKEIASLKKQIGAHDDRLLELMEILPSAQKAAEKLSAAMHELEREIVERRDSAQTARAALEKEHGENVANRPAAASAAEPGQLAKYEAIRQRHAGIGMAEIAKGKTCGACGMALPERTLQGAAADRVVTCDSCHRILYYTEGLV